MEFASYLAGERWSDHPACTHPTLARLARLVNDWSSDTERTRLSVMVPSVVGLAAPPRADRRLSERLDLTLALLAATAALPIASEFRQRALAVTVIRCIDRIDAAEHLDDDLDAELVRRSDAALESAPGAARWARHQISSHPFRPALGSPIATEAMMVLAVTGIAEACAADVDGILRELLSDSIDAAQRILLPAARHQPAALQPA